MKEKIILLVAFVIASIGANAQDSQKDKNVKFEILAGYCGTNTSEPFDEAKFGYNIGLTARKDISPIKEDKIGLYGLTGLIFTKRGGKIDRSFMTLLDDKKNFGVSALSVPIHVGAEYKFSKVSVFADLGPNLLFATGGSDIENISSNTVAFGAGFNIGIRFKRFALSFGCDQDLTNIATFNPDYDQKRKLDLDKDKYNLKTGELHIDLRWTLGKVKK